MQKFIKPIIATVVAGVFMLVLATNANAQAKKVDPTGTWKWSITMGNNTYDQSLKLKMEGEKLTGTLIGGRNASAQAPIENAKLTGDEISFQVTRERGGEKMVANYKGKITDDTIKGTIETTRGEQKRTREWEAKREK